MFFQKNDPVHKTMRRVVKQLEKAKIPYAIVGGMAVNAHGYRRTTNDVDVLLDCRRDLPSFASILYPSTMTPIPASHAASRIAKMR